MRDYGKVSPRFWTGTTGKRIRACGVEAQIAALYLMTCPASSMTGLYYLPLPTLAHETGLSIQGATKALARLSEADFAHYDTDQEVAWVPEMAKHQIGEELDPKDKRILGVVRELAQYRKCRYVADFYDRYRAAYHLPDGSPFEGPPKPHRSQEQEQEQEQEQVQEPPSAAAEAATAPAKGKAAGKRTKAEPLAFKIPEALAALAAASGGRFVPGEPRDVGAGRAIAIQQHIRRYPVLGDWRDVAAWLAAGGLAWKAALGVAWLASDEFRDAMAQMRVWRDAGRGPVPARGQLALARPSTAPTRVRPAECSSAEAFARDAAEAGDIEELDRIALEAAPRRTGVR